MRVQMTETQLNEILMNSKSLLDSDDEVENIDLAGFQVTRSVLFAHTKEPSVSIWNSRIKFNMACIRRFPGVTHIQILIHTEQKRMIIRPCDPDAPDSLRWARGGGEKELANRDLMCRIFAAKVFDLMGWSSEYHYRLLGKPAVYKNEMLFLFKLTDFELLVNGARKQKPYLPGEWRDYFGVPVEQHEESYKVDLADGYITTDRV